MTFEETSENSEQLETQIPIFHAVTSIRPRTSVISLGAEQVRTLELPGGFPGPIGRPAHRLMKALDAHSLMSSLDPVSTVLNSGRPHEPGRAAPRLHGLLPL